MMSVFAVCSPDVPVIAAPYLFGFFGFCGFRHPRITVYSAHIYSFDIMCQCIQCMCTISMCHSVFSACILFRYHVSQYVECMCTISLLITDVVVPLPVRIMRLASDSS